MREAMRILLVEDDPYDVEMTLRALRQSNLQNEIQVARDGVEALEILAHPPAGLRLVLLDLKLPKVDGLEVLQRIREMPQTKWLPVVILTSSRESPDIERAYALGVNSYIVKPVEFERFCKVVADLGFYWLLLNEPPV